MLSSRVGWLLTSQSFLFVLFKFGPSDLAKNIPSSHALLWILPLIGISASFAILLAVLAALTRIRDLRRRQERHINYLNNSTDSLHSGPCDDLTIENICTSPTAVHFLGALPPLVIPLALLLAWLYIFGAEGWKTCWEWLNAIGFDSDKGLIGLALVALAFVSVLAWFIAVSWDTCQPGSSTSALRKSASGTCTCANEKHQFQARTVRIWSIVVLVLVFGFIGSFAYSHGQGLRPFLTAILIATFLTSVAAVFLVSRSGHAQDKNKTTE